MAYKERKNFGRKPIRRDVTPEVAEGTVIGRNAVRELLKSGRDVDKIFVQRGEREGSITVLVAEALARKIPVVEAEKPKLDAMAGGGNHQGVVAMAAQKAYATVDEILDIAAARGEKPFVLILDGVEDPHNLGAIIRSADVFGVHGVIIPKRRASGVTATVEKASAGALEHMAVAKVTNIADTVDELKKKGLWIYAAEVGGEDYDKVDFGDGAVGIVLGSEGYGTSRLVLEKCDFRVTIPNYGHVNSLNVSCAAAVVLAKASGQRHR